MNWPTYRYKCGVCALFRMLSVSGERPLQCPHEALRPPPSSACVIVIVQAAGAYITYIDLVS